MSEQRNGAIPVFFCIDVETDERPADTADRRPWAGFAETFDLFEEFRPRLAAATGAPARISWFLRMDPQIELVYGTPSYGVEAHPQVIERIEEHGDVIGVHPHAFRWDPELGRWFNDLGSQEWMDEVVETSFGAYRASLGRPCTITRFGARWWSFGAVPLLERLGARYDLSLEPGKPEDGALEKEWAYTGVTLSNEGVPRRPYRPSLGDFRRPEPSRDDALWLIPLSTARWRSRAPVPRRNAVREPHRAVRALGRRLRHPVGWARPPVQTLTMWRRWPSPASFWRTAERLVRGMELPYLAFAIRSDLPHRRIQRESVTAILEELLRRPLVTSLRFTTPEEGLRLMGYDLARTA